MPDFEKLFEVPTDHDLEEVRSKSRAGVITGIYWTHDLYDPHGQFIARFESFDERHFEQRRTGWRKFAADGALVEKRSPLWPGKDHRPAGSSALREQAA